MTNYAAGFKCPVVAGASSRRAGARCPSHRDLKPSAVYSIFSTAIYRNLCPFQ